MDSLPGEYPTQRGNDYVSDVCIFFENKMGFSVEQNCLEGPLAATVQVEGETIRFDILMRRKNPNTHLYCECKWRKSSNNLKKMLKEFIEKAIKVAPDARGRYDENFMFVFITNIPFHVYNRKIAQMSWLRKYIGDGPSEDDVQMLSNKLRILVLSDLLLDYTVRSG